MKEISVKLDNLSLKELEELLRELKTYNNFRKQLGKRADKLFNEVKTWKKIYEVEYFPAAWEDLAWEQAEKFFEKVFDYKPKREEVTFIPKESLAWWIKIYVDSKVLDLSYENIERLLKA